jgi:hypothetical protein
VSAIFIVGLLTTWRASPDHRSYQKPLWWVWEERWWKGYRRAQLPAALVITSLTVGLTVPPPAGVYLGLFGFAVFFATFLTVVLFNQPKVLVPPSSRRDEGAICRDTSEARA